MEGGDGERGPTSGRGDDERNGEREGEGEEGDDGELWWDEALAGEPGSSDLDRFCDVALAGPGGPEVCFEPMLPRVYEIMLPSMDARLNFINVGRRHAAFLRHVYGVCGECGHGEILRGKVKLLAAILTKLLDVNGILERKDSK